MSSLDITETSTGVRFTVYVQPNASRSEVVGLRGTALKVRLQAPPVDGAANKEVIRLLAKALDIPRSSIRIAAGEAARLKRVEVPLDEEEARARL